MIKLLKSFGYAINGILIVTKEQMNFRIHLLALLCVSLAGFLLHITTSEWIVVFLCCAVVMVAEMFNSALEYVVDFISPDYHEQAGKIKDIAAGAVLLMSFFSVVIAVIIFGKYILELIK